MEEGEPAEEFQQLEGGHSEGRNENRRGAAWWVRETIVRNNPETGAEGRQRRSGIWPDFSMGRVTFSRMVPTRQE